MSKSNSCLDHNDTDVTQEAGITADWENKTKKPGVTRIHVLRDQTGQSYGDVLDLHRHTSHDEQGDQSKDTTCNTPFTTDLKPKDAWVEPDMALDQFVSSDTIYNEDVLISVVDKITQEKNVETATEKSLVTFIGVSSKEPTSSPSAGYSRPQCRPSIILVNGEWVNLNKQPCILVRFKHRMARVFRRMNRCYEEMMLDLVMLRARIQANKKRDEGLRQQNV
ncbi:uncharacterized protein LOC110443291 [Mizuhopecten yessoensis]|uniref:uncharacterized protein LOC110443291 n=1 Tax=Mizuhopecten yessoensis TaxID=6573 RepID=UPI000B457330|nr:uncharacterized protein LOC110443291 [Mizuhopecten yessoensis]